MLTLQSVLCVLYSLFNISYVCLVLALQCVPRSARCDGPTDCVSGLDERQCPESAFGSGTVLSLPPPALVLLDGRGSFTTTVLNSTHDGHTLCPDTHFQCPHDGYCLPVYVRCNGVYDCPGNEDEADCSAFACPGFYRCRASVICLHVSHLCDGFYQCPQHDDELFCRVACPETCTCVGLSLFCRSRFEVGEYPEIRFLDAGGTGMTTVDAANNSLLIHLGLASCGLADLEAVFMPNLRSLDLSDNELKYLSLDVLRLLSNLQTLVLAGNPLSMPFNSSSFAHHHSSLRALDLSRIPITVLKIGYLGVFPNVQSLNLSYTSVQRVAGEGFQSLRKLRVLDLRGCPMVSFPRDLFQGLVFLSRVQADNYKLCCPAVLPRGFNVLNCRAPSDEISSCDALLRSDVFRVFLSVFAALALLGNLGSFVYRVFLLKASSQLGFGVFVTHLCVSDFLMGVYLLIIGVADRLYQGAYLWNDTAWKESGFCRVAGFLSLLSSEVSAFLVCLITLDRCLVLKFPFSRLRFRKRSAHVACALAWTAGLVLSAVPLLPVTSHWHFYSQTGICIPLPITRKAFPGHFYSFAIMITFNFALFILIALGQAFIYWSVTTNRMSSSDTSRKSQDLTIARRLITVAVSDFLCWFPIGLLGSLAAYSGVAIPSGVNVAMAIFVLPLNSALNPFLYTLNILLERRRIAKERRLEKRLMVELQTNSSRLETPSKTVKVVTEAKAMEMIRHFLAEGVLRKEVVSDLLGKDTCDTKI